MSRYLEGNDTLIENLKNENKENLVKRCVLLKIFHSIVEGEGVPYTQLCNAKTIAIASYEFVKKEISITLDESTISDHILSILSPYSSSLKIRST